jgi:hypothetical protein
VVVIYVKISLRIDSEIQSPVEGELRQHMIEKSDSGGDISA